MKYYHLLKTPIGELTIIESNDKIVEITLNASNLESFIKTETKLIKAAKEWLISYFKGEVKTIDFPYYQMKTSFQNKVYEATQKIPFGTVKSYLEVAIAINHPKAYRAVGNALNKNDLLIVVPCHRVVGSNGLGGFGGGIAVKKLLLKHEKGILI
ncbi:MAG: methylated-DNA--[protein]-cysteine S-methyltransferase [Acholeplasmataceae bacterium]|jgi:methylated-DNA-[protein]-cysteine S-methyltransferase|nr:methylated-DNA--[protein]-cysteine S-methyltransferase [Acholeplasmataceae bacterium]